MADHLVLPNLCRNSAVLVGLLLSQFGVIAVWLVIPSVNDDITSLGLAALYVLFAVMIGTSFLCIARQWIARQAFYFGVISALLLMVVSVVVVELAIQQLTADPIIGAFDYHRLATRSLAALIVSCVLLRFFSLIELFDQRSKAEAESRILALQSRIQPHFLFNSLNTISELAVTDSKNAEKATTALASLFRASLENDKSFHSLAQEIELCERYLELERYRIQDKLLVDWHSRVEEPNKWRLPKLMLQPLVENALVHGKQASGHVSLFIDIRETKNSVSIRIENKVGELEPNTKGHGVAIKNIQQRLETLYDDKFTFRSKFSENVYSVLLRIPKQAVIQASSHISTPGG